MTQEKARACVGAAVRRLAYPLLLLALQPALRADVLIKETLSTTAGGKVLHATRSIAIKGERMRIEVEQDGPPTVTLFDLPAGVSIALDAAKRRASVTTLAARAAELEKTVPRARVTTTMTAAGAAREIAGVSCQDHRFAIRVPATNDGEQVVVLTGTACVAPAAPGAGDYAAFVDAAAARGLVIGYASSNKFALAVARGRTELCRALASVRGIPYLVEMTSNADGKGLFNRMLNKLVAASSVSTVTTVTTTPMEDARFAVPDGWTRQQK